MRSETGNVFRETLDMALDLGPECPNFARVLFALTIAAWAAAHQTIDEDVSRIATAADDPDGMRVALRAVAQICGRSERQVLNELKLLAPSVAADFCDELSALVASE